MCGIWGKVWSDPSRIINQQEILSLCQLMAHRGPDGDGAWADGAVGLGHRRLSIIDLAGGDQPMAYAEGRYWITYNGEIYNYQNLKAELSALGYPFQTQSDTEVILAAYAHWGVECPRYLNGIFAFGIWDKQARTLFLARDHFGIKPLLYHHSAEGFTFSSELKPLIAEPYIAAGGIDRQSVADYLALGYVLSPRTIVQDVYRLPPAHYLLLRAGEIQTGAYWNLAEFANQDPSQDQRTDAEWVAAYRDALTESVKAQLVADVPLGAFLSGGIDSSSVVALMGEGGTDSPRTFSMGFSEKSYSELDYAQVTAEHLGTVHHSALIQPERVADELAAIVWAYDEPLGDTSLIPMYYLSRLAAEQVKVALSGDGADENLAGYDTYVADKLHGLYRHVPLGIQRGLVQPLIKLLPSSTAKVNLRYQLQQFTRYGHESAEVAHYRWRELFSDAERGALLPDIPQSTLEASIQQFVGHYAAVEEAHPLNQALYVDMQTWMLDDILPKVDRASMAASLEVRVPFLDPRLAELSMLIPTRLKMNSLQRKVILKRAMGAQLPPQILKRRKRGFNAPTSIWMAGILRPIIEDLLAQSSALVDVNAAELQKIWRGYLAGEADHAYKLWALVSLLLWERHVWQAITQGSPQALSLS